jgi:hypothetical protein
VKIVRVVLQDIKLALKAVSVSKLEDPKRKGKVQDLNQLRAKIEKSAKNKTEVQESSLQNQGPEIPNKNPRFPTFRYFTSLLYVKGAWQRVGLVSFLK